MKPHVDQLQQEARPQRCRESTPKRIPRVMLRRAATLACLTLTILVRSVVLSFVRYFIIYVCLYLCVYNHSKRAH